MNEKNLATTIIGSVGDGILIGEAISVGTTDMEYIPIYLTCASETGHLLYVEYVRLEGCFILVNKEGKRFVEELERSDVMSKAVMKQSQHYSYMLWDQSAMDTSKVDKTHKKEYANLVEQVMGNIHGTNRLGSDAIADIIVFDRIAGNSVVK